jgi:hypothetical protein
VELRTLKQVVLDCDMRLRGINLANAHRVGLEPGECAMFVNTTRTIVEVVVAGTANERIGARRWRRRIVPFDLAAMGTVLEELGVTLQITGKLARKLEDRLRKVVKREAA